MFIFIGFHGDGVIFVDILPFNWYLEWGWGSWELSEREGTREVASEEKQGKWRRLTALTVFWTPVIPVKCWWTQGKERHGRDGLPSSSLLCLSQRHPGSWVQWPLRAPEGGELAIHNKELMSRSQKTELPYHPTSMMSSDPPVSLFSSGHWKMWLWLCTELLRKCWWGAIRLKCASRRCVVQTLWRERVLGGSLISYSSEQLAGYPTSGAHVHWSSPVQGF